MGTYRCPLCTADFVEPSNGLPRDLAARIARAHRWDGKVPLCVDCAEYFEDLWKNEHTHDLKKGLELYGIYRFHPEVSRIDAAFLSLSGQAQKHLQEKADKEGVEATLKAFRDRYFGLKVDPYAWHSGKDYWPLVNPGAMTFSRQCLYSGGIRARVMRSLKRVAIDYLEDHLNVLREFRLGYHEKQLELLQQWLKQYHGDLGEAERVRLGNLGFEREVNSMIRGHRTSLEAWTKWLQTSGWLRQDRRGGPSVQIDYHRAVARMKEVLDQALGTRWKGGGRGFTKLELSATVLMMMGIWSWRLHWTVEDGWVRLKSRSMGFGEDSIKKRLSKSTRAYTRFLSSHEPIA